MVFDWAVSEHTARKITVEFSFEDPASVSNSVYGRDKIIMEIMRPSCFVSNETGESVTMDNFQKEFRS